MGVNSGGLIFFDITKLIVRTSYKTPTGSSRVEMAYAIELLRRYPERIRFVIALERMVQVVPVTVARRYLTLTELSWRDQQTKHTQSTVERIAAFLKVDVATFLPSKHMLSKQPAKYFLAANALLRGALNNLLPRGLQRYSSTPEQHVYVHVSGSNFPSHWIERWLARSPSVSSLFLVHDVIPITHPEYVRHKVPARHAKYVRRVIKAADAIVANSSFTADALKTFAREKDLKAPNVAVALLGTSEVFEPGADRAVATNPYFVFVSTIEPRKNHLLLLQVWSRLVVRFGDEAPKLILVGRRGWENENVVDILERAHTSGRHVLECNDLCDETLATLIRNARAALMPSHVEGYGLPVAEALALGTPVICSDLAPFREIAGDIPEYVDPLAGRGWAKLIMEYARNGPARRAQIERLKTYRPPTWDMHFENVGRIIDGLAADHKEGSTPSLETPFGNKVA